MPSHPIICRPEVHEAEVQGRFEAHVLANGVLQDKCLVIGAVLRSVACLSRRPQALLLCEPKR